MVKILIPRAIMYYTAHWCWPAVFLFPQKSINFVINLNQLLVASEMHFSAVCSTLHHEVQLVMCNAYAFIL